MVFNKSYKTSSPLVSNTYLLNIITTLCDCNPGITCDKPSILNGNVSPSNATVNYGESYELTCDVGYIKMDPSTSVIRCGADGSYDHAPSCGKLYIYNKY